MLLLANILFVYAQANAYTATPVRPEIEALSRVVTASDYAAFLNQNGASDPEYLYDQKIGSDPTVACIVRVGVPGNFHYEVMEGRENFPMGYLNEFDEEKYCKETGDIISDDDKNCDPSLRSNLRCFAVSQSSNSTLTLAASPASPSNFSSYINIKDASVIALAAVCMITPGGEAIAEESAATAEGRTAAATQERSGIVDSLRMMAIREPLSMTGHYEAADALHEQTQAAWDERTAAQQDAISARELDAMALELRDKVKKATEEENIQETILGRISHYTGEAVKPLSFIPGPIPLGGVAATISEATDLINRVWVKLNLARAEIEVRLAKQKKEETAQRANAANTVAVMLERRAKETETTARADALMRAKADAEALKPPSTSLNSAAWNTWAADIVAASGGDAHQIINHGMSDPTWAANEAAAAWLDRMAFSERNIKNHQANKAALMHPHEQSLQQVNEATRSIRKAANLDKKRLKQAVEERHAEAKNELEKINEELNELEASPSRPGLDDKIQKKREKFSVAFHHFEQACRDVEIMGEAALRSNAAAAAEEAKAVPIRKNYAAAERFLSRAIERAKIQLEADRAAWRAVWPERLPNSTSTANGFGSSLLKASQTLSPLRLLGSEAPRTSSAAAAPEEKLGEQIDRSLIAPPLIYDEDAEALGRSLLRKEQRSKATASTANKQGLPETLDLKPSAHAGAGIEKIDLYSDEPMIPKIIEPTEADEARWKARKKADKLIEQAAKAAAAWAEHNDAGNNLELRSVDSRQSAVSKAASSVGSFVKSIFKPTTIAESASEIDDNTFAALPASDLEEADRAADEAELEWKNLAETAEADRIIFYGIEFDSEQEAMSAWKRADRAAITAQTEKRRAEKEAFAAERVEQDWDANTARWMALAEADSLAAAAKDAKALYAKFVENPDSGAAAKAASKAASDQAKRLADEAKQKWSTLAHSERSIIDALAKDPAAVEAAKEKLEAADRAVNTLANRLHLNARFLSNKQEVDYESPQAKESRLRQEAAAYRFDLMTKKNEAIARYFQEADSLKLTAQEKYRSSDAPNIRAQAEALYATVDHLEEVAMTGYADTAERDALKAARNKTPGVEEAWDYRIKQSVKAAQDAKKRSGVTPELWADDALRTALREKEIARADIKALKAFHREAARLDDIETTWIASMEAEARIAKITRERAAKSYADGESDEWNALPAAERAAYNEEVKAANKVRNDEIEQKIEQAITRAEELSSKADKLQKSRIALSASKRRALEATQKAEAELNQLKASERERQKAIRWAKFTPAGRNAEIEIENDSASWDEAKELGKVAGIAFNRVCSARSDNDDQTAFVYDEAIERCRKAQAACEAIARSYNSVLSSDNIPQNIRDDWGYKLAVAENNKALYAVLVIQTEAMKALDIERAAWVKAKAALDEEAIPLFAEAIQKRWKRKEAWTLAVEASQEGRDQTPFIYDEDYFFHAEQWTSRHGIILSEPWGLLVDGVIDMEQALKLQDSCRPEIGDVFKIAEDAWYEALVAYDDESEWMDAASVKFIKLWEEALQKIRNIEKVQNQLIEAYQVNLNQTPQISETFHVWLSEGIARESSQALMTKNLVNWMLVEGEFKKEVFILNSSLIKDELSTEAFNDQFIELCDKTLQQAYEASTLLDELIIPGEDPENFERVEAFKNVMASKIKEWEEMKASAISSRQISETSQK